jgi:hypothetical protein
MRTGKISNHVAENLRYLLWRRGVDRQRWVEHLAHWIRCERHRAADLLRKGDLEPAEAEALSRATGHSEEDVRFARLAEEARTKVLLENLRYLVRSLERGQKKALAADLDVHATTISRWCSDTQRPEKSKLVRLLRYFGLPSGTDLSTEPLFLSLSPISVTARKEWLRDHVDRLDAETLSELFPALERLLEDR